jgi:tetratricopeptide (TPR) repeat protein
MTATFRTVQPADLDSPLGSGARQTQARYHRASALAALGRNEEAKQEFLAVIAEDPQHFGALNDLGTLLYKTDYRTAARLAYAEAIKHHPCNVTGHINLANALWADGRPDEARPHFETALVLSPDHPDANQGMANLLQDLGEEDAAEVHRQKSYLGRTIIKAPYRGAGDGGGLHTRGDAAAASRGVQRHWRCGSLFGGAGLRRQGSGSNQGSRDQQSPSRSKVWTGGECWQAGGIARRRCGQSGDS